MQLNPVKEACEKISPKTRIYELFLAPLWHTALNTRRLAYLKYLITERKYKMNDHSEKNLSDNLFLKLFGQIVTSNLSK